MQFIYKRTEPWKTEYDKKICNVSNNKNKYELKRPRFAKKKNFK